MSLISLVPAAQERIEEYGQQNDERAPVKTRAELLLIIQQKIGQYDAVDGFQVKGKIGGKCR
jgi:hypothetical protein